MNTRNGPENARIRGKSGPDENGPETVVAHLPGASSPAPLNQPGGTMTDQKSTQNQEHILDLLEKHRGVNSTAAWKGSPDPSDSRNIRRVCSCGEVISQEPNPSRGRFSVSGDPFDAHHRAHIAEAVSAELVPAGVVARRGAAPKRGVREEPERLEASLATAMQALTRVTAERDEARAEVEVLRDRQRDKPVFHCQTHMCGQCGGCKAAGIRDDNTELRAALGRVEAVADDADDEHREAMDEVESLRPGTREHGEWTANAITAAEVRDRIRAALSGAASA